MGEKSDMTHNILWLARFFSPCCEILPGDMKIVLLHFNQRLLIDGVIIRGRAAPLLNKGQRSLKDVRHILKIGLAIWRASLKFQGIGPRLHMLEAVLVEQAR